MMVAKLQVVDCSSPNSLYSEISHSFHLDTTDTVAVFEMVVSSKQKLVHMKHFNYFDKVLAHHDVLLTSEYRIENLHSLH